MLSFPRLDVLPIQELFECFSATIHNLHWFIVLSYGFLDCCYDADTYDNKAPEKDVLHKAVLATFIGVLIKFDLAIVNLAAIAGTTSMMITRYTVFAHLSIYLLIN